MTAFIPTGRAVNPVTKKNWEGVGVEPDVKVKADDALKVAYASALEKVAAAARDAEQKSEASPPRARRPSRSRWRPPTSSRSPGATGRGR